jgi:hypothetical protein
MALVTDPDRARANDYAGGQSVAGVVGVRQGQGSRLSARVVDDASLARHAREHGAAAGHGCLSNLVLGAVCKILGQEEIKPHKMRYHLERGEAAAKKKKSKTSRKPVAIVSYDEKPGIQAIATTSPDLPPVLGT